MENREICHFTATFAELCHNYAGETKGKFELKSSIPGGIIKGASCTFKNFHWLRVPTFSDYLRDGYQVSLIGAVDFTYSNGLQSNPSSLHHTGTENQYMKAIKSVGEILHQYDSDKVYPFYGFGGAPTFMGSEAVSHCFPLNGSDASPEIAGIDNVLKTYRDVSSKVKLLGPTHFAPMLQKTKELVLAGQDEKMYYILLILTDGEIHDMEETMKQIKDISDRQLPVSIIIVGVGSENFANMVKLDGDDVELAEGCRDLVQFVKYEDVIARSKAEEANENLAALVLEEVPGQFVKAFTLKQKFPTGFEQ